ncbi:MAG: hypothetical protein QM619_01175 [Micropruina sp.]|uniref:hypothetical protein n=1 Tax=Micropruina sp. TaxID=2737536 RepID=UPI0039E6408C
MRKTRVRPLLRIAALALVAAMFGMNGVAHAETKISYPHLWASNAPAYQRLPDSAPVDANSETIVQNLKKFGIEQYGDRKRGLPSMNLAIRDYSNPLWAAKSTDPKYDIEFSDCQNKGYLPEEFQNLKAVNIPDQAHPAKGTDGQVVIYNTDTGRYVDLWRAYKQNGHWYACWGGSIANSYQSDGIFPFPSGVSASGAALEPYTVKVAELRAGHIDHVIGMSVPPNVIDRYVSKPATRSDGSLVRSSVTISEGQILRLPADLDIDALNLHPVAKTIAKAAQEHGFMVMDGSGGISISLESSSTFAVDPYLELFGNAQAYNVMWGGAAKQYAAFPFDELQALERDYVPTAAVALDPGSSSLPNSALDITFQVTDERATSFGFKAIGAPIGARMKITWWRSGQGQFTTVNTMNWWSGTNQAGYRNAQATVIDASGKVLATSPIVKPW